MDSIQYQIDANYLPDGWRSYMAKAVKEAFAKPVITTGNIRDPKVAQDILERGDADLIGMGRQMIADPNWKMCIRDSSKLLFLHECLEFLFAQRNQIKGVIRNPFMNIL